MVILYNMKDRDSPMRAWNEVVFAREQRSKPEFVARHRKSKRESDNGSNTKV